MNRQRSSVCEITAMLARLAIGVLALPVLGMIFMSLAHAEGARLLPAPVVDERSTAPRETAVLAGGCFWGLQGVFQHVKGVTKVVAGYAGGEKKTAQYELVSDGNTGHAESVQISFDPKQVSYGELLRLYFSVAHDPTQLDRQGPDKGMQYRSEIFFTTPEQERVAKAYIEQLGSARVFSGPIITKVRTANGFYAAEAYHQDYLMHHPESLYIQVNDIPKIKALRELYPQLYQDRPVTLSASR